MEIEDILSKKNFQLLSREIQQVLSSQTWLQLHGWEWLIFVIRLVLFALAFWWFAVADSLAIRLLALVLLSYLYYGIGITGTHETGHRSFTKSVKWNKIWGYFFSDFWASQSSLWWYHRHVKVHHAFTNIPSHEPQEFYYPWLNKYVFFFITPYLVLGWLIGKSIHFLRGQRAEMIRFLICMLAGILFHIWLFTLILPLPLALLAFFIMRSLFAPVFVHLATFNHIGLENPDIKPAWLPHQTRTTRNLKPHWFLTGMGGNAFVDCHIEHHLFPSISNRMLAQIRPITLKFLKREGYNYVEETYVSCLSYCLKNYRYIFHQGPVAL